MKTVAIVATLLAAPLAWAAPPAYVTQDTSTAGLIDKATVDAICTESLPRAKLARLYPPAKWGFLSQVGGGMAGETCVITARVALLPRTSPTRRLVWEPEKLSTAFDAKPGLTAAQCGELARDKLKEALASLVSSLVK